MISDKELLNKYDLGKIFLKQRDSFGEGENFWLYTEHGKFFLKTFNIDDKINNPFLEVLVNDFLRLNNIPVPKFIKNREQQYITKINNKILHIQEFVEGETFFNNKLPQKLLIDSAELLGKIHSTLSRFEIKKNFIFYEKTLNIKKNLIEHIELYKLIEKSDLPEKEKIISNLKYKITLLEKYLDVDLNNFFSKFTYTLSHGDYNCRQLIIKNNEIVAVVDFSKIMKLPVVWEVTRSYTIGSQNCVNGNIDLSGFKIYLNKYQNNFSLTQFDVDYMWEFYKIQLLESLYGYREYFYLNNKDILKFAFWRTNIIYFLEERCKNFKRII